MSIFKRDRDEKHLDELARAILVQEQSSLRAEILASYGYAQSIVRWTLATFAAVAAAGLVAVYNASTQNNALLFDISMLIFGAGIPAIVWLNAWTWLGELYRAERAGSFLRKLENDLASVPGLIERLGFQPARWESFIWSNRRQRTLWGKQVMTYLGTAGVFLGAGGGSLLIFFIIWNQQQAAGALAPSEWILVPPIGYTLVSIAGIAGCVVIFKRLMRLGDAVAPVASAYPAIANP